ncbi:MAG: tetratricopeptide repeat protein [Bacteroidota bacterium]
MVRSLLIILLLPVLSLYAQVDSTGIKLINEKKFSEAQEFFERAVEQNGKSEEARYYLAMALMLQQKFDDAQDAVDEAIDLKENDARYHLLRGQILGQKAMTANVISQGILAPKIKNAFLRASELDPSNVEARQALYNYYVMAPGFMGGSNEKAFDQANAVVKLDAFRGHLMLANYYNRVKKDSVESEKQIKKAIQTEPERGGGYKNLGYFYMRQGRFAEAYAQMQKYIDVEPKNPDSYDSYGDVLKEDKKFEKAIEKYFYALSIDKNFSASIFSLGECYEQKGLKQKAKETFQWFLNVEPQGRRAEAAQKKIKEL